MPWQTHSQAQGGNLHCGSLRAATVLSDPFYFPKKKKPMGFDSRPKEWVKPHQNWCTRFWVRCPFDSRGFLVLGRTKPLMSDVRGTRFLKPDGSTGSMLETGVSRLASSDGMEEGLLGPSFRSTMGGSGAIRAPGLR